MLNVGSVVKFVYEQGHDNSERIAKVINVRDLRVNPLSPKTVATKPCLRRNRYLVTARQSDGKVRCFYTDEMASGVKTVGLVGRVAMYAMGIRF